MKLLYAVYDKKASAYGPVMQIGHDAVATREFGAICEHERSTIAKYPEDFELHCIGEFHDDAPMATIDFDDDKNACVRGITPRVVITAVQWFDSRPRQPNPQLSLLNQKEA